MLRLTLSPELNKFIEDVQADRLRQGNRTSKEKLVLEWVEQARRKHK